VSKLERQLVLFDFVTELLGGNYSDLVASMKGADLGTAPGGQSYFFSVLDSRGAHLKIDRSSLAEYDSNILTYESSLGRHRSSFRFTYFQYLAALYSEIYLDHLASDRRALLDDLRGFQRKRYSVPRYEDADLDKLSLWMATGSGKTLLAHVHLLQWKLFRPFEPDNIVLVTPNAVLSEQHIEELALSGVSARRADLTGDAGDVQVIEITKLYVDGADTDSRRGGVSLPVSMFEGRNLVLVDEGHKGSTSAKDMAEERKWRDIRKALVRRGGFTIEYSATFAQITDKDEDLLGEYSKSILVDYGYRRFWEDKYGKDYRVVNLTEEGAYDTSELLLAGLLILYEQRRFFEDHPREVQEYNLEAPLMVFVGATVTGKEESEVLEVVKFLDRILLDSDWAIEGIGKLLRGKSGLPSDLFSHTYPYLNSGDSPDKVYASLCESIFHGQGRLAMHHIRRADGEIGLRTMDASEDLYCGVINVGSAAQFFNKAEEAGIAAGEDDHISPSLFARINDDGSPVNLLVGSRKFIEGWSSWRVSTMGLLNVGKNSGPQVIQLFGRGIRLKGLGMKLQRSEGVAGDHPEHLHLLETLHILGVKADYMKTFNETIRREGLPPPVARALPIKLSDGIDDRHLLHPDPGDYRFDAEILSFDPGALGDWKAELDLVPKFTVAGGIDVHVAQEGAEPFRDALLPLGSVDGEQAFLRGLEYKRQRRWSNIYLTRQAVYEYLSGHVKLRAPESLFSPLSDREIDVLQRSADDAVRRGLERFAYTEQRKRENEHLSTRSIKQRHPNFPRPWARSGDDTPAYLLEVPEDLVTAVDKVIEGMAGGNIEAWDEMAEPLPRLFLDFHLYAPLLVDERGEVEGQQTLLASKVRSIPQGLVASEVTFIRDLRDTWLDLTSDPDWDGWSLHVLRNLPKRGVGFFTTAGFYPDFLVWLTMKAAQALAFVEPHGMVIWDQTKVDLLKHIRETNLDIPMLAYIVTKTEPRSVGAIGGIEHREDWFRDRHILFQDGTGYIQTILEELRQAIEEVTAGKKDGQALAFARSIQIVPDTAEIEDDKFKTLLPVYDLEAAAGHFGEGRAVELEGWVEVPERTLSEDMFVARVVGSSMEPRIADGDLCIFRQYRGGTRRDRIMLVQWAGPSDPDTGGSYAVKKFSREQQLIEDGELRGVRVTLSPINPEYEPITLTIEHADEVAAVAEYVDRLGPTDGPH
jgi:phage repressor protein C with HTH and peptisase S24 domain